MKSLVAMTHVHAVVDVDFKNCCLQSGRYDGAERGEYF